jgi:hypothetical protein
MKHFIFILFTLMGICAQAQKITIDLPHFAGKEYVWFMINGDRQDTIKRGVLDAKGQTVLNVPPARKNWQGMSHCLLTEGGGLEIILNGEGDFTAGCAVAAPTIDDIYYVGSKENIFLIEQYRRQQRLMNKAVAIAAAVRAYTPQEPLYRLLENEKKALEQQFADLQRQTAESPLYAARVRQMSDYCNGSGSRLDITEKELQEEQRHYVREVLDFRQLWNNGLWKPLFAQWISTETAQGDSILLADSKAILARVQDREMRDILLKKMTALFHQYGKEGLLTQFGVEDLLSQGHQAPKLYLPDNNYIVPLNSLVIFYESGCNNCENELLQLRGNYPFLQEKNIRVISVSADTDEAVYNKNAGLFPWQHKLCDYKGHTGTNFRNYAVIGTPTIYVIDGKGVITGRYARLAEYLESLSNAK